MVCEADRDAQLLAEQEDFSDLGVDDQSNATSDEWFADEDLQEAVPDWLDVTQITQPPSNEVYPQDDEYDADYDQLVALAESSLPSSQVSGNVINSDLPNTIDIDHPMIDAQAPCTASSTMKSEFSQNFEPSTMTPGPKAPPGKSHAPSHNSQMKPPPRPLAADEFRFNSAGVPLPFVRRPFPKEALLEDSPIQGLQNHAVLRTVFRVGEAINAASSSKKSRGVIVELYARVIRSSRLDFKQYFLFADLFTDKPPYLGGTYGIWKGVKLWEEDAGVFLGDGNEGKLCRVVGTIKTKGSESPRLNVLSIWECTYEDVRLAKGIACS
ncbi:MAG: hypothetical protein OHK93_000973 [Ramalina farinacea]|uniref:Uncharacterized protein n=1 Tax=Ramalina farinacea TaxID=258253 RepID=A0AA43QNM1_9LECA|nr:hypothetical protein [Ramalina farinacea]